MAISACIIFKNFPGKHALGPPQSFSFFSISFKLILPKKTRLKKCGNYSRYAAAPRTGMGNLFRYACQNRLKSVAKFLRVPTDSSCFPLKIPAKSKKKGLHVLRCLVLSENVSKEQKRKVFTSLDVLFSPENVGEEKKRGLHMLRCPVLP